MLEKIKDAVAYLQQFLAETPEYAIVLGSGLGKLEDEVENAVRIDYKDIPHFPVSTVEGHSGELIYGQIEGRPVLMMAGRFHYYEGYSMDVVTFPMRVFKGLGIDKVVLSNASGGVNPEYQVGDAVVVKDHINFFPEHPLRGQNLDELGPRFVDMSEPYDRKMIDFVVNFGQINGIEVKQGIYLGLQGPTFETPAEYGMVRILGADCVGMSTVPEVIVAKHQGMRVFCVSVITDLGGPDIAFPVSHEEVLDAANKAMPKIIKLVKGLIHSGV
ncbi:MAG TPA: purine-nucleoside phosphorylase [Moheibacter sp.]|nr:purine-nucleoside phosphorylase [Moheibacter sp.]